MKLEITGNQTELTLQNKTHVLECVTKSTFETNRISSLRDYLSDFGTDSCSMYYGEKTIEVWPVTAKEGGSPGRYEVPIAVCNLEYTDEFTLLYAAINEEASEKRFCEFLRVMVKYAENALQLKDSVENMEMKKIVSMSKSKDSRGNFSYEYSVKDAEKATFTPPAKVKFTIPIFKHIDKCIVFQPDLSFRYNMVGADETKEAKLYFKLEMLNLDQFVEEACTAIIETQMEQFTCRKYWGTLRKVVETDEWKYKDVPMSFVGLPEEKIVNQASGSRY